MIRKAFKMKVYSDQHEEYHKRHNELWPEMETMLKEHGLIQYSIFLDEETSTLFAYLEIADENNWDETAGTPVNKKWWDFMAPIMETNSDNSPVTTDLKHVFHLEQDQEGDYA